MFDDYREYFVSEIPKFRLGKYAQVVLLRETQSYTIFTTEGQRLDQEALPAGRTSGDIVSRVVMFKRKQVAAERRRGKELLRMQQLAPRKEIFSSERSRTPRVHINECEMMGNACGQCVDCVLYGFAATTGTTSQRSRVLTDSAFSIRPVEQIARDMKLNAIQETTAGGIQGSAFAERQHLLPQVLLPCVESCLDVTAEEFAYVLGNVIRTSRYGAETSREGLVHNHVLAIAFSDTELFSNLELTQLLYDDLLEDGSLPAHLGLEAVLSKLRPMVTKLAGEAAGQVKLLDEKETAAVVDEVRSTYQDKGRIAELLTKLDSAAVAYAETVKRTRTAASADDAVSSTGD